MSYPLLRQGDKLPAVGVLQKLLNRTGESLDPDGDFGSRTKAAVIRFQTPRHLSPDGAVGQNTWPRISANANLPVVDCIDVFDPSLAQLEERDIRRAGGNPIVIGGMSNGVEQAVNDIVSAHRNLFLLRFHGHGAPGTASISSGHGELDPGMIHRADITLSNLAVIRPIVARLRTVFGPYGCVQFMHCETGRGPNGRRVLQAIADELRVPVSAGINTQFGGGTKTFRFEGPTFTALPSGTLAQWCRALPNFAGFNPS
jgi:peptidoglycan hydrolase-like protein with peptidoglycan-binding domain